jgi:hypothetical protein
MKQNTHVEEERLLTFARRYLSEAFPNPERAGCPDERALRSMAVLPRQADPAVGEHLALCSPCFKQYMNLLAELRRQQQTQKQPLWKDFIAWPKTSPIWIGSAVMVIGLLSMIAYFVALQRESPRSGSVPPPIATMPGLVEYSPFELDLRSLSPTRAPVSEKEHPVISVPRKPLEISFLLPVGTEEGTYRVSLKADGKQVWTAQSEARLVQQRTTLRVRVNLSEFPPGTYTIEVESESGYHLRQPIALQSPEVEQKGKRE